MWSISGKVAYRIKTQVEIHNYLAWFNVNFDEIDQSSEKYSSLINICLLCILHVSHSDCTKCGARRALSNYLTHEGLYFIDIYHL